MKLTQLCKRTDYPKLGYIIHRLNNLGIACSFKYDKQRNKVSSFHADHILLVEEDRADEAWALLSERWNKSRGKPDPKGRTTLDNMPDDAQCFSMYANETPEDMEEDFDPVRMGWVGRDGRP